jgi:hypothetical protein
VVVRYCPKSREFSLLPPHCVKGIVRLAALYDIHGNIPALESVLEELQRVTVDQIV